MAAVTVGVSLLEGYAMLGIAFAILFVTLGVQRVDPQARGAGAGFRLLILPGAAALWPLLLVRWLRGASDR